MMKSKCKRIAALLLALIFVCLYADSHLQHDIWMTRKIVEQQEEINYLIDYIKRIKQKNNK